MASISHSLQKICQIWEHLGTALVDIKTVASLAQVGGRGVNLERETNDYASIMRSQQGLGKRLLADNPVQEMVFTLRSRYDILYPFEICILKWRETESLFFFVALSRNDATLAQVRSQIQDVIAEFSL